MGLTDQDCPADIDPAIWKEHLAARNQRDIANLQGVNAQASGAAAAAVAPPTAGDLLLMRERSLRLRSEASGDAATKGTAFGLARGTGYVGSRLRY